MFHRNNLPLSALNAFECAARTLHLGRAGEELGVTSGAVSHQIRHLEDRLQVELFSRAHGRLALTSAGERLYQSVREGLDVMARGTQTLDPGAVAGTLTIGCTPTIGASWLLRIVSSFGEAHPEIDIFLEEIRPGIAVLPGHLDLAVTYGKPADKTRQTEVLCTPDMYPVCSPKFFNEVIGPKGRVDFDQLVLLHNPQNPWEPWFRSVGIPAPKQARNVYFASTLMAMRAAQMGLGVALCNTLETRDLMRDGLLTRLVEVNLPEAESYYLATNPSGQQTLRAQLFAKWVRESMLEDR